ncbi:MAG TPA: betaine--homocysteine S-methyltransferase [Roseiarcus sp.]|jgi:5-methyltetrahydrofolate--homocysteine methyltransferase
MLLQTLLAEGRPLLADGATGTNLFDAGLTSGDSPELWNATRSDAIRALHRSFADAGADILLTNSFGANRRRLALHGLEGRVRELNRLAAENARAAAAEAGRPIVVAGSVGPTGDLLAPLGPLSEEEAVDVFAEQIEGLREGGADVVWIETMSAAEEIRAAAHAAARLGMPYTITASFDTAGKTMMGLAPATFADLAAGFATAPLALGANCGVGAADLLVSILGMTEARPDATVIAKANAGVPQWHGAHIHYSGSPELMGVYAALAVDAGARIVGGCCGTTPVHLAAMRRAVDAHRPGRRPDVETIVAALGALVSAPAAEAAPRTRRRGQERAAQERV